MVVLHELRFPYTEDESVEILIRVICEDDSDESIRTLTTLWGLISPMMTIHFAHNILNQIPQWSSGNLTFSQPAQIIQQASNWTYTINSSVVVFNSDQPSEILITIELGEINRMGEM